MDIIKGMPPGVSLSNADYDRAQIKIALGTYTENDFKANSKVFEQYFIRNQCYLFPKISEEKYKEFVLKCLDIGIVISPDYNVPSIMPWRANPGDLKKISKVFGE